MHLVLGNDSGLRVYCRPFFTRRPSMRPSHTSSIPDRAATFAGIVGALLGAIYVAIGFVDSSVKELPSRAGVALALFAGGVAMGWIGRRVGTVMSRVNDLSAQIAAGASEQS